MALRLTETFEDVFEYDGEEYQVDMAFDNILIVFEVLKDGELTDAQKVETALYRLIEEDPDIPIQEKSELLESIIDHFLIDEKAEDMVPRDIMGNPMPVQKKEASYSFTYDAEYIYSSFMQAYGIDLFEQQGKLHWKKFAALLQGLPDNTMLMRIIDIRQRELPTGKGTEKERAQLLKLKQQYKLPEEER